jgi:hypothetical protein
MESQQEELTTLRQHTANTSSDGQENADEVAKLQAKLKSEQVYACRSQY